MFLTCTSLLQGITFNRIIIRVHDGTASDASQFAATTLSHDFRVSYPLRSMQTHTTRTMPTEIGVEIEVDQMTDGENSIRNDKTPDSPWTPAHAETV